MTRALETGEHLNHAARSVGLPPRPFLYTIDQLSVLVDISESSLRARYIYFEGRTVGAKDADLIVARNIAPANEKAEWRIAERELVRWMKRKGFRYYERSSFR